MPVAARIPAHANPVRGGPRLPMDTPTIKTRRVYGDNPALRALVTRGSYSKFTPIQDPYAGGGGLFPAFPKVQPSEVAPNGIKVNYVVALNKFSPSGHHNPLTESITVATLPTRIIPKPSGTRRGTGGNFTIPARLNVPSWPTSSEWLRNKSNNVIGVLSQSERGLPPINRGQ